jgi:hypothetical protein
MIRTVTSNLAKFIKLNSSTNNINLLAVFNNNKLFHSTRLYYMKMPVKPEPYPTEMCCMSGCAVW